MIPGVYQTDFRGLTVREAWRFSRGPFKFIIALVLKVIAFKGPNYWLPPHECEETCGEDALSPEARTALLPLVEEARALGYGGGQFSKLIRILDPGTKQGFGFAALHRDRQRVISLGFIVNSTGSTTRSVVGLMGALVTAGGVNHEFLNHHNHFDNGGITQKHYVRTSTIAGLDTAMQQCQAASRDTFRSFADFATMKAHAQSVEVQAFDTRIARGLLRYAPPAITPPLPEHY